MDVTSASYGNKPQNPPLKSLHVLYITPLKCALFPH